MTKEYIYDYPMPSVTADTIVYKADKEPGSLKFLLVKRKNQPFKGKYAFPGGFSEPTETMDQTASRELEEETGIHIPAYKLNFTTFLDKPDRDPRNRTISFVYSAMIPEDAEPKAGDDASEVEFKSLDELSRNDMAFDHYDVLRWFCERDC